MTKIIAREVPPEQTYFADYFDGDVFSGDIEDGYIVFIPSDYTMGGLNNREYIDTVASAKNIWTEFWDLWDGYETDIEEAIELECLVYSRELHRKLERWARYADPSEIGDIAEYLTITTGMKWDVAVFNGYSQGDYCEVLYCVDRHTEKAIIEIGKMYLGCGSEFFIDDCRGYFVIDDIVWEGGELLKKTLADMYGCDPGDMEVYVFDRYDRVPVYEIVD